MNSPYMDPEDACWTPQGVSLRESRRERRRQLRDLIIEQENYDYDSGYIRIAHR